MKTGLVLEGGAMRGMFTAGALDYLLEQKFKFSYVIGVSAGSGIAVNFVAEQIGRSKKVITHENAKPYYGLSQLFKCKHILNLERFVISYARNEIPLDFDTFHASQSEFECVSIDCLTGQPRYFSDFSDDDKMLKYIMASCAVPFACAPVEIDGNFYLDGSIVDSIPVERAIEKGCDKVFAILTRPEGAQATDYSKTKFLVNLCYKKKYPKLCEALLNRKTVYDAQMERLKVLEEQKKVFFLRPQTTIPHFEKDEEELEAFYISGYETMKAQFEELKAFLADDESTADANIPDPDGDKAA